MLFFTGDIHGSAEKLRRFCNRMNLSSGDIIVILGDVGANYYGGERDRKFKEQLLSLGPVIFCVHGNHENRPANISSYSIKEWCGGHVWYEEQFPNLLFARDGDIFTINGIRYLVIGGAFSVDKAYRLTRGLNWWCDEQPNEEIKARVAQHAGCDGQLVILSHTCPSKYVPKEAFIPGIAADTVDSSTEDWLDTVEESFSYCAWFCGHWHIDKRTEKMIFLFDSFESDEILRSTPEY